MRPVVDIALVYVVAIVAAVVDVVGVAIVDVTSTNVDAVVVVNFIAVTAVVASDAVFGDLNATFMAGCLLRELTFVQA